MRRQKNDDFLPFFSISIEIIIRTNDYMENDGRFMFFNRTHSMCRNAVYIVLVYYTQCMSSNHFSPNKYNLYIFFFFNIFFITIKTKCWNEPFSCVERTRCDIEDY